MWRSKWLHNIFFDVDGKRSCCHEKELRGLSESTLSGKYRKILNFMTVFRRAAYYTAYQTMSLAGPYQFPQANCEWALIG